MTHDLMRDILTELSVVLDHVVITELKDQTFYAELRLHRGSTQFVVSARPSDAIALAVRAGATIYAEEALLDAEGIIISQRDDAEDQPEGEELVAEFHDFIEGVRPEDFGK
jgi:bifunctional DNase/RNase